MRCHNAFFYLAAAVAVSPFPGLGVAAPAARVGRALPKVQYLFSSGFEDVVVPGCRLAVEDASHGEGYIGNVKISVPRWMRSEVAHAPIFIQRGSPPKPLGRTLGARELATFLRKRLPRRWSIHLGGASRQGCCSTDSCGRGVLSACIFCLARRPSAELRALPEARWARWPYASHCR